ncbi:MAG: hypothetical protein ACHQRM_00150 [Bacteroidia bacterium]
MPSDLLAEVITEAGAVAKEGKRLPAVTQACATAGRERREMEAG